MAAQATLEKWFFSFLLIGIATLSFLIFRPYLGSVILAGTFAVIFYPFYQKVLGVFKGNGNIAALVTTLLLLVIVIIPLIFFGYQIFREAQILYGYLTSSNNVSDVIGVFRGQMDSVLPGFSIDFENYSKQALQWVLQHVGLVFSSVAKIMLSIFLSLFAFFYLLRDGEKIKDSLLRLSPLKDAHDQQILATLQRAINSVIRGSLAIALIQGIVTGVGFALFGVPNPALWGSITILAALIPSIGTAAVLIPAIAYLFLANHLAASIGLAVWGVFAVGLIDNFLGPKFIGSGAKLHPMVILLAVIGGLQFFGPIGYIIGPLVASLLFALLDIYPRLRND